MIVLEQDDGSYLPVVFMSDLYGEETFDPAEAYAVVVLYEGQFMAKAVDPEKRKPLTFH